MKWASRHIEKLKEGKIVEFRPRGNSMVPLIKSGQLCKVVPVIKDVLNVGDIVLCSVGGNQYLHKITAIVGDRFQISNNQGHINGWTKSVYGLLISVSD